VDDDADFRDGLAWLLDSRGLPTRVWTGGDAFVQSLQRGELGELARACCVVLLDIRMEPLSGLATFEQLKAARWPWPVLFLTGHGDVTSWWTRWRRPARPPCACTPRRRTNCASSRPWPR